MLGMNGSASGTLLTFSVSESASLLAVGLDDSTSSIKSVLSGVFSIADGDETMTDAPDTAGSNVVMTFRPSLDSKISLSVGLSIVGASRRIEMLGFRTVISTDGIGLLDMSVSDS